MTELEGSCALENGYEIPDAPERYLVVEKTSGERVWTENCSTLQEAATAINDSSTDREEVFILDLDAKDSDAAQLIPVLEVTRIFGNGVDLYTSPLSAAILPVLTERFPWLSGDDRSVSGADTVDQLTQLYKHLQSTLRP